MKKALTLGLLSLILMGCGTKYDKTECISSVEMEGSIIEFNYEYESKDEIVYKEKRTIHMTYKDDAVAEEAMKTADFGTEKGAGYKSEIKKLSAKSLSNVLTLDYNKINEESAAILGLEAIDGNYATGNINEIVSFLKTSSMEMVCEQK